MEKKALWLQYCSLQKKEINFLFIFKVHFHVWMNTGVLLLDSAFTSDIPSYRHYNYGMHSFSVFVLTSKDESLPPRSFVEELWNNTFSIQCRLKTWAHVQGCLLC